MSAKAQIVVTETQSLSFGTFSFTNFNSVLSISIENGGGFTTNGNVAVITPPSRGEFSLTGGPPNSAYTITTPASFTISGPGGNFTVDDIRIRPVTLSTDPSGADDYSIAARIRSLGGGTVYNNGTYNNTFDITIAF